MHYHLCINSIGDTSKFMYSYQMNYMKVYYLSVLDRYIWIYV